MRGMDVHGLPLLFPFTTYWVLIDFFQSHYSSQPLFPYSDVNGGLCLILPRSFSPHLPGWEIERDRRACVCASVCVCPLHFQLSVFLVYMFCASPGWQREVCLMYPCVLRGVGRACLVSAILTMPSRRGKKYAWLGPGIHHNILLSLSKHSCPFSCPRP